MRFFQHQKQVLTNTHGDVSTFFFFGYVWDIVGDRSYFLARYDMVGSSRKLRMGWKICPIAKTKVLAGKKGMRPEGKTHRLLDRLEKRHSKPKGWVCLFPCRLKQTLCGSPANSGTKDVAHEFAGKKTLKYTKVIILKPVCFCQPKPNEPL